ncbi:MAG TPA: serine/threonine-protein kinase [Ktedonobacterales bacterium]|nr:serine/threonine-protein kinase [Ktedonobacterales bacterium]
MHNLEGRELGGCKLLRKLGAGGMGEVYLAEQRRVGNRMVAVKIVSPEDMSFRPEVAADMTRRFEREIKLLGSLSHPNILPIYDSGEDGSLLYIVMEYAQEGSLADAMRGVVKQKLSLPVPAPRAVEMIGEIAAALQFCHEHGVVHRDVKPGNVLIHIEPNGSWRMLLADFGVARGLDNTSQRTQVTGTFAYMAPEQFSGEYSPKSDQYALAVMAFQLLAGKLPFEGDLATLTRAHMYDQPPSLHAANPNVSPAADAVLARALAKRPGDRYASVAEFAAALAAAVSQGELPEPTTQIATPLPEPTTQVATPLPAPAFAAASAVSPHITARTDTQRARRRLRPGRVLVTLLAAALLLIGVYAGTQLLHNQQPAGATATQTAQAMGTATALGTVTSTPADTPGTTPNSTFSACGTLAGSAGCTVATPTGFSGTQVLNDPAPNCGQNQYSWNHSVGVTQTCSSNGVTLVDGNTSSLGCMEAQATSTITTNGFAAFIVTPASKYVALAFRQSAASTQITGYYFALFPDSTGAYSIYKVYAVDAAGNTTDVLKQSSLPSSPGATFTLGVQYSGATLTFYVDNKQVATATDSTYTQGIFGMCTQGSATFRDAQVYKANS